MASKIPVTVLTGFLGAGKTTLLNRILSAAHGRKLAVIVNEFGEIGIDGALIVSADEEIYELSNGCVCCSIRGDLVRVIGGLLRRAGNLDAILIETTGLADPAPVAQTFLTDRTIADRTTLDSVIALIDAAHVRGQLQDHPEAERQIAFADALILNKTDLVDDAEAESLAALLRGLNPFATLQTATRGEVQLEDILGRGSFSLDAVANVLSALPEEGEEQSAAAADEAHGETCACAACQTKASAGAESRHDGAIRSLSLTCEKPLDGARLQNWLSDLAARKGADLLRYKGLFNIAGEPHPVVIQGVQMMLEGGALPAWPKGATRHSRFVLIGRDLDPLALRVEFLSCVAV